MRRTFKYAAMTRDENNAADGRFPTASQRRIPELTPIPILASPRRFTGIGPDGLFHPSFIQPLSRRVAGRKNLAVPALTRLFGVLNVSLELSID
jgi:hypothetical protein